MKRKLSISLIGAISTVTFAGGTTGTNPPAREALEQLLLTDPSIGSGGLFLDNDGRLGLGVNGRLDPVINITRNNTVSTEIQTLSLNDDEIDLLNKQRLKGLKNIDAVSILKKSSSIVPDEADPTAVLNRSYIIDDGETIGSLILRDRKDVARAAVNSVKQ